MEEEFVEIRGFPSYFVSNLGRVTHIKTRYQREMTLSPTQKGELTVGLMLDGVQYRRSVKVLVAEAFVPGQSHRFNTPIQLDDDRDNLRADNLAWRPRWFAWKYRRQFDDIPHWVYTGPIFAKEIWDEYETIIDACMALGLLWSDLRLSMYNDRPVFPTTLKFTYRR